MLSIFDFFLWITLQIRDIFDNIFPILTGRCKLSDCRCYFAGFCQEDAYFMDSFGSLAPFIGFLSYDGTISRSVFVVRIMHVRPNQNEFVSSYLKLMSLVEVLRTQGEVPFDSL